MRSWLVPLSSCGQTVHRATTGCNRSLLVSKLGCRDGRPLKSALALTLQIKLLPFMFYACICLTRLLSGIFCCLTAGACFEQLANSASMKPVDMLSVQRGSLKQASTNHVYKEFVVSMARPFLLYTGRAVHVYECSSFSMVAPNFQYRFRTQLPSSKRMQASHNKNKLTVVLRAEQVKARGQGEHLRQFRSGWSLKPGPLQPAARRPTHKVP